MLEVKQILMAKKKALVVHQQIFGLEKIGGAEAVCVRSLEALKDEFEVHFVVPYVGGLVKDVNLINKQYGSELKSGDFVLMNVPLWNIVRPLVRWSWFLHTFVFMAMVRRLAPKFDLCLSTYNEFDFGPHKNARQYLHYPMLTVALTSVPRKIFAWITGFSYQNVLSAYSYTCSEYTRKLIQQKYPHTHIDVLYAPVRKPRMEVPAHTTNKDFIYIGRISREKRIEECIKIVEDVRKAGYNSKFTIVGPAYDEQYHNEILLAVKDKEWVTMYGQASSGEIDTLMSAHGFGINGTKDEQFGITIAEMCRCGVLVFVPNGGGQLEVVDNSLVFENVDDAVSKIVKLFQNDEMQAELRKRAIATSDKFDAKNFIKQLNNSLQ